MHDRAYGFVGLGNMGVPMCGRLLAAGHALAVHDLRADAAAGLASEGAAVAASLADLGAASEVVFLSLPTPEAVRAVAVALAGCARVQVVVDLSTTGPRVETEIAQALAEAGKTLVDCPVSGGVAGAKAGTLAMMAAGDPAAIAELAPVLAALGKVFTVGERPGQGQTMKLINNLMSTAALTIASETLVMGVKAGLDPDRMIEVLNAGTGGNSATANKIPKFVLPRTFDFGFSIGLSTKDARLCVEEGDRLGVPMIVGGAVRTLLAIARDRLGPETDLTGVIRVVEEWAGVEVKGKAAKS
ncbi:putative beta-hydroxyacid dehydrogenase [uncultured Alphaproteobacteria bacterium]|uniref:Putative beta-hydroxyacid dehydrogenase n=1 Tax=uncultured Alphaproteobacteria bacterium TaxID=91750 RepID=A0A212KH50_9PROT|nr:putative beta-hydroxyacid dehydrogenase [uncultured Alphaproteobacteria bacterium]